MVQRIWRSWTRGAESNDPGALRAPFDEGLLTADSTFTPVPEIPGATGETYVGLDGFVRFVRAWQENWTDWTLALDEVIDAGHDRVVAVIDQTAVGRGSGARVTLRFASVVTLRDRRVVDRTDYGDVTEALRSVGLSE